MTGDSIWVAQNSIFGFGYTLPDGFTMATPLGEIAQGTSVNASVCDMIIGLIPGSVGETSVSLSPLVRLSFFGQTSPAGRQC